MICKDVSVFVSMIHRGLANIIATTTPPDQLLMGQLALRADR